MSNIIAETKILDKTLTIPCQLIEAQKLPTLILGGGFTGLFTALHLSHQHYKTSTILIDRGSRFIFKLLLYEFLTGEMNTRYICPRYDNLLHKSGIQFIQDTIESIDLKQRHVRLASGHDPDFLSIAAGWANTQTEAMLSGSKIAAIENN